MELQKIKNSPPQTNFKIDIGGIKNLPPFGRSNKSNLELGKLIYNELI